MTHRKHLIAAIGLIALAAVLAVLAVEATRASTPPALAETLPTASASGAAPDLEGSIVARGGGESGRDAGEEGTGGALTVEPRRHPLPERLTLPAIGVETPLERLDLGPDGALATPVDTDLAGWFERGPRPGAIGPAVIAGHVSWNGDPSVFFRLTELQRGDRIEVGRADGSTVAFEVSRIEQHAKDAFPTVAVYANTAGPELRLITCGGEFDRATGHFDDNIVVFAKIVQT